MGGWTGYAIRQGAGLAIPMGFLTFSRGFEREADYLGLQYMYKSGYDPTAFVDFFEKIESLEKRKPGSISKVFSTHPMTDDRIKAAQNEIQKDLAPKPEYVVNTSEFNDVKGASRYAAQPAQGRYRRSEQASPAARAGQHHRTRRRQRRRHQAEDRHGRASDAEAPRQLIEVTSRNRKGAGCTAACPFRFYSYRSARTGSSRAARRAGR